MMLDSGLILEILPLDPATTAAAQAAVELVIVQLAVWLVVKDIERGRREGLAAGGADEARFVVPPCQAAVGAGDGLAFDGEPAGFAVAAGWVGCV
jgi:hypothetical protein